MRCADHKYDLLSDSAMFLRMAAFELRRLVNEAPEIAEELQQMSSQLDAQAAALARTCRQSSSCVDALAR